MDNVVITRKDRFPTDTLEEMEAPDATDTRYTMRHVPTDLKDGPGNPSTVRGQRRNKSSTLRNDGCNEIHNSLRFK